MSHTWIAFLRGMNVGGHRITNADLQRVFSGLGFGGVATYRASGNVLFTTSGVAADLRGELEAGLREALGYDVPTFLRSADELRSVAAMQPFTEAELAASRGKVQVTFLGEAPKAAARDAVLAQTGRELYWLPQNGILDSALDWQGLVRLLGEGTTRTAGTVEGIVKKLGAR
jgi:uncharacterized protein (DUF1697 family)